MAAPAAATGGPRVAKVTMPQLGESVVEGTIGKWLKQPGDHVAKYEPLLEVITDKVNAEVPSPFEGILKEILVEEGATVPNNAEIAVIEEAGASEGSNAAAGSTPAGDAPPAAAATGARPATTSTESPQPTATASDAPEPTATSSDSAEPTPAAAAAPDESREPETKQPASSADQSTTVAAAAPVASAAPTAHGPAGSDERGAQELPGSADARMTPAVRRLLREHGLTAAMIVGTGGGGRITREDVTDFVESQRTSKPVGRQNAAASAAAPASAPTPAGAGAPAAPSATAGSPVGPGRAGEPAPAGAASRGPTPATQASPSITFPEGADEVL